MPRLGWIAVSLLLLSRCAFAQPAPSPDLDKALAGIRPEAIRGHMRFLADDLLEGRGAGTRGYDIAAEYVASQFEAAGLEPAGVNGTYFQPVPLRKSLAVEPECSLTLELPGKKTTTLKFGEHYVVRAESLVPDRSEVTAPVVFVGFGVTAPELGYDDYAGVDVKGKIVAMLSGAPEAFPHNQRAYYSSQRIKGENAVARGAIGIVGFSTPQDEARFPWWKMVQNVKLGGMRWVNDKGVPDEAFAQLRGVATLSKSGAEALFADSPKALEQVFAGAKEGRPQSFDLPVRVTLKSVAQHTRVDSPNVAAVLRGADPKLRDEYVLYTAHLDHLGIGEPVKGDKINNGALDNASGIAAMIEAAKALSSLPRRPRRSLLFVAVTAEEKGLRGADYFAQHPTVPLKKIVADVNLDMFVMIYPVRDVVAYGAEHSSLGRVVEEAAKQVGFEVSPDPAPEETVFIRSDQFPFVRRGVPALFVTAGMKSGDPKIDGAKSHVEWRRNNYHAPQDDMSQPIDFDSGARFARLNVLIGWQIAEEEQAPRWNTGDFFGEKFGKDRMAPAR
ncbi:MAG TPA: M28 family metallopeptidase [Thermoanaerobaculia bacterium]|nr:M28 family metallopeptidase [Thermoanaerobaculia bacterium]